MQALWLLSASPIVLFNFVVAGHNDALMLAFIVAGMYYACAAGRGSRWSWWPAPSRSNRSR